MPAIGIVAGEASGDVLGGELMSALRKRAPEVEFAGVGGPRMQRHGMRSLADIDNLSINGLVQPVLRLPALWGLMNQLESALQAVDVFVGVDFNVFNLRLEWRLRRRRIPTAHYVSPSVYAWRRGRVQRIGKSTDVVMTLFPFEPSIYEGTDVRAEFVGHPLAEEIAPPVDRAADQRRVRELLGLRHDGSTIALMPGSRESELKRMGPLFLEAASEMVRIGSMTSVQFVVPCPHDRARCKMESLVAAHPGLDVSIVESGSHEALRAADLVLVKAGTGTLEALLTRTPMVVTYLADPISFAIVRRMMHTSHIALPNILAGRELVPELLQDVVSPRRLAEALLGELRRCREESELMREFDKIHRSLLGGGADRAAEIVLSLLGK